MTRFAMGIILDHDERLLIVRYPAEGLQRGLWGFPVGEITGDDSPEAALQRSLRETLAITIGVVQQLPAYPLTVGGRECRYHPMVCTLRPGAGSADGGALETRMIDPANIDDFQFAPPDAVAIRLILELYRG